MTKTNINNELRDLRNEMFPGEYTKLEFGTEIKPLLINKETEFYLGRNVNEEEHIILERSGYCVTHGEDSDNEVYGIELSEPIEIIGQPLTTLDILRMMETLGQDWILSTSGMLYESDMKRWQLNMSKNLFTDQPQETQEAVYELLINDK